MVNLALLEGWPLVRGIVDIIIHSLFSENCGLIRGVAYGEGGHI